MGNNFMFETATPTPELKGILEMTARAEAQIAAIQRHAEEISAHPNFGQHGELGEMLRRLRAARAALSGGSTSEAQIDRMLCDFATGSKIERRLMFRVSKAGEWRSWAKSLEDAIKALV